MVLKKYIEEKKLTNINMNGGEEDYYTESVFLYDDGINFFEILEERKNSDWKHPNKEREVYIYEPDYELGISKAMLEKLYDLIQAGLIVKE